MIELRARDLTAFHDSRHALDGWAKSGGASGRGALWQAIEDNHRCNCLLWDEEDLARRRNVADAEIAANKRAIDGHNQRRNDAVERIDEQLLAQLPDARKADCTRLSSETAGAMTDRLSILSLKIHHMRLQTLRTDVERSHVESCRSKLNLLNEQRADLATCLDRLLAEAARGEAYFKIYRQFKMYNDPALNPAMYGEKN
ncbi:MAG: DUF4254 domain-containing protein [Candidatus Parcubacteria bacterium]|nr:DUF4254 domain-containing protein [Burkholderiales bacterium]